MHEFVFSRFQMRRNSKNFVFKEKNFFRRIIKKKKGGSLLIFPFFVLVLPVYLLALLVFLLFRLQNVLILLFEDEEATSESRCFCECNACDYSS
jgi:hypothetical protein